jgi:ribosomal protein S13
MNMEYALGIIIGLVIIYKIIIGLGRKNAKDVLVANYGLSRQKLDQLSDPEITSLTISLNSFANKGEILALTKLIEQFK